MPSWTSWPASQQSRCGRGAADALAQCVHQVDDVLTAGPLLRGDRLAGALLIDEVDERGFVLVFELVRLEPGRLLVDDMSGQIEHVLCDFDVLDIVEILLRIAHLVWIAQQSTASGAAGGTFGLAALPVELPVSTVIMLRSIADIARSEGDDLSDPEAALSCVEVFALGGRAGSADASESGYFAVRGVLAKPVPKPPGSSPSAASSRKGRPFF
jgi:hypothetical protein